MKIIESIVASTIVGLCMLIGSYFVGKRLVNSQKEDIKEEILAYLSTPEGQQSISNLGQIFASGIVKGIGVDGGVIKGKTLGVSNQLLMQIVEYFKGKKGDKAINKESSSSSSDPFGT